MIGQITINMNLATRPAIYTVPCDRPKLDLLRGEKVRVDVLGLYQVAVDEDIDAYFVVTLPNGKCTYVGVDTIQFTDMGVPECD